MICVTILIEDSLVMKESLPVVKCRWLRVDTRENSEIVLIKFHKQSYISLQRDISNFTYRIKENYIPCFSCLSHVFLCYQITL